MASPALAASLMARLVRSSDESFLRRLGDGVSLQGFLGPLHERRGRGVGLEMAVGAARALAGILHLDDDVPALGAVAVPALDDPTFLDDPAADPRAQGEQHEAAGVPSGAGPVFAIGGGVGVVLEDRRLGELLAEQVADRQADSSRASWAARGACRADRSIVPGEPSPTPAISSQDSPLAATARRPASARLLIPTSGPSLGLGLQAHRRERLSLVVDHAALDVGPAEVDAQVERRTTAGGAHGSSPRADS